MVLIDVNWRNNADVSIQETYLSHGKLPFLFQMIKTTFTPYVFQFIF